MVLLWILCCTQGVKYIASVPLDWQLSTSEYHQSAFKHLEGHKQGFVTEQAVVQNLFVQKLCGG